MSAIFKDIEIFPRNMVARTLLVVAISLLLIFVMNKDILLAIEDPDTDKCAQCHRSHTGVSEHLTTPTYQNAQCLTCHNGTGSSINVAEDFMSTNHHSLDGISSGSEMQCASCHEAHIHVSAATYILTDPQDIRKSWTTLRPDDPDYDNSSPPSGIYLWCERCHTDSEQNPIGTQILSAQTTDTAYIPYNVTVAFQTPHSQVDDNGDTDTAEYWQYFSSETVRNKRGYNDERATGKSAHGKASSSTKAIRDMVSWKGNYGPDSPALPCTDCHTPHGSNQPWMIVDSITVDNTVTAGYDMTTQEGQQSFCESCHVSSYSDCSSSEKCTNCHRHGDRF